MDTNKIIEINGTADIYVRAICDIEDRYHKDDLVATLYGKTINLNFQPQEKDIKKATYNLLSYYDRNLSSIDISELSLTEKILDLFHKNTTNQEFAITCREVKLPYNGRIYLNNNPVLNSVKIEGIDPLTIEIDYVNYSIYSDELVDNQEYVVTYKTNKQGNIFSMNRINDLPYFSLEIHFEGNGDKENERFFMFIPRAKIINMPVFTPPAGLSLSFMIIHEASLDDEDDLIKLGILNG